MDTPKPARRGRPRKTEAPKRAPGRPAAADNPDLRERLLDAAIACYARQGIAATSLRLMFCTGLKTPFAEPMRMPAR